MNSRDTLEEIRNYLEPMGFKEFEVPNFRSYDGVCTMFQKRYDDNVGKKYFIDAKIWDWSFTDRIKENYHIEYECQLYQKDTHDAFNINFIDWTIEQVEQFIDNMFEKNMLEHYETWE